VASERRKKNGDVIRVTADVVLEIEPEKNAGETPAVQKRE
jgi:hypothetical protein